MRQPQLINHKQEKNIFFKYVIKTASLLLGFDLTLSAYARLTLSNAITVQKNINFFNPKDLDT